MLSTTLLVLALVLWAVPVVHAVPVNLTQTSSAFTFPDQTDAYEAGDTATSVLAPAEAFGQHFTHWEIDGVRQVDPSGRSMNPLVFQILGDETATAQHIWSTSAWPADTDSDGLLDWLEVLFNGNRSMAPGTDADGDGFDFAEELQRDYHPALSNRITQGGITSRDSVGANFIFNSNFVEITEIGNPAGFIAQRQVVAEVGSLFVSTALGGPYGDSANQFVYWTQDGSVIRDAFGVPLPSAVFTVTGATTVVAQFLPSGVDSDLDGVDDWFEEASNQRLSYDADLDKDDDLFGIGTEFRRGYSPALSNSIWRGGVTSRDSGLFPVNIAQWPELTILSSPRGVVPDERVFLPAGSTVLTPLAPVTNSALVFGHWTLDGVRALDPFGAPYNPVPVELLSNTLAIAVYYDPSVDADADGVPDGFEIALYGDILRGPGKDSDFDGFGLIDEYRRGTSPVLEDTILQGGITSRDSTPFGVDLRFFPLVEEILVDGQLDPFFAPEAGQAGSFRTVNGWSHPALGDWDGDGDLDLFVAGKAGEMHVFENAGSPVYMNLIDRTSNFTGLAYAWTNNILPRPAMGDWNNDFLDDLAIGSRDGTMTLIKSSGHFGPDQSGAIVTNIVIPGATNVVPAFALSQGGPRGKRELAILVDGKQLNYYASGVSAGGTFPHQGASIAPQVLESEVPEAWSVSGPGPLLTPWFNGWAFKMFVSDRSGRIWQFEGSDLFSYSAISKVYAGTSDGFANGLSITVGDVDGDGDEDVLCGFTEGGLLLLRNNEPKLVISPPTTTVVSGDEVALRVLNTDTNSFINYFIWPPVLGSLGSIARIPGIPDRATFTAGPRDGYTDSIVAYRPSDLVFGLSYVNVISPDDITRAGKAIIVAGGKSLDDPVWRATDHVADYAFNTLRFRGFSKETLHYLSFDPDQDVDGNGLEDDIDGFTSFANVENAFTNHVDDANKLFVYMANHGSDASGLGFFRLNSGENLSATNVNAWLNRLQDANTNLEVTIVLDFCYSGSFIDELAYTGTATRVVISATGSDELTYFIAGGLVSFSDIFFSALLQGLDLETAYRLAADAMSAYQNAWIDDNKDGVFQSGVDGAVASGLIPGASFLVGRDVPIIGDVSPSQVITGTSAMVWADNVSSVYPIERVWGTIIAPSHRPNTNAGVPVVDVPETELFYNHTTRRYEATLDGFTEQGSYQINVNAQDIWGSVSFPRQTVITQSGFEERLIIVVGGPSSHPRFAGFQSVARTAYLTALARQFNHDDIYVLMPGFGFMDVDGDGTNDVDSGVTQVDVDFAFLSFAPAADRLTVCMIGDTSNALFQIDGGELSAAYLDGQLDTLQAGDRSVNVLLEFDGSGAWPPALQAPLDRERIVIASTRADRPSLMSPDGLVSFAQYFLSEIFQGKTIGRASTVARKTIRRASGRLRQRAGIDDDGDGDVNEKNVDGLVAANRYIGPAFVTGDDIPFIGEPMPSMVALSNVFTIWAADVLDVDGISNVWAVITPPNFDDSEASPVVPLTYHAGRDRFEAVHTDCTNRGLYVLTFYATDTLGQLSAAVQSTVTRADNPNAVPDVFEPDDTPVTASAYNRAQVHTFHASNDVDWTRIYLLSNFVYDVETIHHDDTIDTVLDIFYEDPDGTVTNIERIDDFGFDEGELTGLDFPRSGWYRFKVSSFFEQGFEPGAYTLIIDVPAGGGAYFVMAVDLLTGAALPAGTLLVVDGGAPLDFNGLPSIPLDLSGGTHTFEVVPPAGYFAVDAVAPSSQIDNPSSEAFGNPRNLLSDQVNIGADGFTAFVFFEFNQINAQFRDAFTGGWVPGVNVAFDVDGGPLDGAQFDRYPLLSTYGTNWMSTPDGLLPTNVFLIAGQDYRMRASAPGYLNFLRNAAVPPSGAGVQVDLSHLVMVPVDADGNGVADIWELAHLGTNAAPGADGDGDGLRDIDEYHAGTDPTNASDVFAFQPMAAPAAGPVQICWPVSGGRTYEVLAGNSLSESNWPTVFGPWLAPSNGVYWWGDPGSIGRTGRVYRVNVVVP